MAFIIHPYSHYQTRTNELQHMDTVREEGLVKCYYLFTNEGSSVQKYFSRAGKKYSKWLYEVTADRLLTISEDEKQLFGKYVTKGWSCRCWCTLECLADGCIRNKCIQAVSLPHIQTHVCCCEHHSLPIELHESCELCLIVLHWESKWMCVWVCVLFIGDIDEVRMSRHPTSSSPPTCKTAQC